MTRLRRHESLAVNCDDELLDLRDSEVVALRRRVRELETELATLKARWLAPMEREDLGVKHDAR